MQHTLEQPPTLDQLPEFLTIEEYSAVARVSRSSAYDCVRRGVIPSVRFGVRSIRIPRAFLVNSIASATRTGR